MFKIPTKLVLPLPEFLTREYLQSGITLEDLVTHDDFLKYMVSCDQLVTTCDEAPFYLEIFGTLMLEEKFLVPTKRHFAATILRGQNLCVAADRLEKGLDACGAISGPNEALPNVFVAYEFMTVVREFASFTAQKQFNGKVLRRIEQKCEVLHQLAIFAFLMAIKVQLGFDPPDSWQRAVVRGETVMVPPDQEAITRKERRKQIAKLWPSSGLHRKSGEAWTLWNSCNILGKANIILSWYWDGENSGWAEDKANLRDSMKLIRTYLEMKNTSNYGSGFWFTVYDALASYPEPDDDIEQLRLLVQQEYHDAIRRQEM